MGTMRFNDLFDDYLAFLEPRLAEAYRVLAPHGSLYFHVDYREVHYCKVLLDAIFGRQAFLNEIIWAYDYGGRPKNRWPPKHDSILLYVKDPSNYVFNVDEIERIPYMAPGLVGPEKAARGKLPTDVWWHTIVPTNGSEKTGYPTQKPLGILKRIVQASSRPGAIVLDFFAGSGTTGVAALELGRRFILVDNNPEALAVMARRFEGVHGIEWRAAGAARAHPAHTGGPFMTMQPLLSVPATDTTPTDTARDAGVCRVLGEAELSLAELARLGPAQRAEAIRRRPPEVDMDELQLWELGTAADLDKAE